MTMFRWVMPCSLGSDTANLSKSKQQNSDLLLIAVFAIRIVYSIIKILSHRSNTAMDWAEKVVTFIFEILSSCIVVDVSPSKTYSHRPALLASTQSRPDMQPDHLFNNDDEWEVL